MSSPTNSLSPPFHFHDGLDLPTFSARVEAECERAIGAPSRRTLVRDVYVHVASDDWLLEWQLPRWAARACGVGANHVAALTLGNVLGLMSARVRDDALDEPHSPYQRRVRRALANDLQTAALAQFCGCVARARRADFLRAVEAILAEWRTAMRGRGPQTDAQLAARGAPLKICLVAAGILGQDSTRAAQLRRATDELLLALVLLDHLRDWRADLAARRFNAFVAHVSPGAQTKSSRTRHRAAVARTIGDSAPIASYCRRAAAAAMRAQSIALATPCAELARYAAWLAKCAKASASAAAWH